jgi:hypothetical protein
VAVLAVLVRRWCERFDAKVVVQSNGCCLWTGATQTQGYGSFGAGGPRSMLAHRFAYERHVGPVPEGLSLDHLCRNRLCVNPSHLEPVTIGENNRRGLNPNIVSHLAGVCPKGHPLSPRNDGRQRCRECGAAYNRARRAALNKAVDGVVEASNRVVDAITKPGTALRASVSSGPVTATSTPHGVRVVTSTTEFWVSAADAADLAKVLSALPEVAHGWRRSVR